MNNIDNLIRADLREFNAYHSTRDEAKKGEIWLNANESPFTIAYDQVVLNRYPEKQASNVLKRMAEVFNVNPENIALTRGSGEGIDLLIRLFCTPFTDAILVCPPTFDLYAVYAKIQGAEIVEVPLLAADNDQLDVAGILAQRTEKVKIIFLCCPNNPTGNLLNSKDILQLCTALSGQCIVVVDEAYMDYANANSLVSLIDQYQNLVILRTFSKAYGLAAVRCGTILANGEIINWILKITAPYPMSAISNQLLLKTLAPENLEKIRMQIAIIQAERANMLTYLKNCSLITKVWPSETNYLLVQSKQANAMLAHCLRRGIVLRDFSQKPLLRDCLRISIGLPEENRYFLQVLAEVV
jgi:histidinol-phosphate aminotransferase